MGGTLLHALAALTPDEIAVLPPEEQRWISQQLEREMALASPAQFAITHGHGQWLPYRHLVHTSNRIVEMIEHDACDCLVIEQPVRHGKSFLCSQWTPAWYTIRYRRRVLLASYEADFAAQWGRRAREIVAEAGARYGAIIDDTSRAAARWDLVGDDGGMSTAGAGGPLIGKGGGLMIVDDPIKNVEEAQSQVMRDHLWEWWQAVFLTRREPQGKVLVIMSRWHEDDLVARLLNSETGMRVERVHLPALAEENDTLGRQLGQALCPERFDETALANIRTDVGPTTFAAMYQQRPVPIGGGLFKRESFRYFTGKKLGEQQTYTLGEQTIDGKEVWRFATMDPAFTRSKRSDYTVAAVWGVAPTDPPSLMLLDLRRVRVEHAEHAPLIDSIWQDWHPAWVGIEKQMATLSLFDAAAREGIVVRWLIADKNKIARAETACALVDAGRIYLPRGAPWVSDFLEEVVTFPAAAHDDQVDVLSYAAIELGRRTVHPRRIKTEPATPADKCWAQLEKRARHNKHHPILGRI